MQKKHILFVILLLALTACNHHPGASSAKQADTLPNSSHADSAEAKNTSLDLHTLLRPTNSAVVSDIPVTALQQGSQSLSIEALGRVDYDTRRTQTISARFSGRIEKLYVKYRYQHVHAGDKIMDIYSPELVTAQQDLLFVLHNDPTNSSLFDAAKTKLQLLGMNGQQLQQVIQSGKPLYKVTVYTSYTGHIHEAGTMAASPGSDRQATAPSGGGSPSMDGSKETGELPLKEGMYIQKGQTLFQLFNTDQSWIILNLYAGSAARIKVGSAITITAETAPDQPFDATIGYIEPFYREDSKTLTARVYFNNASKMLPIGSQVKAIIRGAAAQGPWLPREAVLSLGLHQVVLKRENGLFQVSAVQTGIMTDSLIQITGGLNAQDSVAADAQYLMDSESFIKVKN